MTTASMAGRLSFRVHVLVAVLLFAPLGVPAAALFELFVLPALSLVCVSSVVGIISGFGIIIILSRANRVWQDSPSDTHDDDLRKRVEAIAAGFSDDMGGRFDALCQTMKHADTALKERQDIHSKLQFKVAEETMQALRTLQQAAAGQNAVQADMTAFLTQAPAALQELQAQIQPWSQVNPIEIDAIQRQLSDAANTLADAVSTVQGNALASDEAVAALSVAAQTSGVAAQALSQGAEKAGQAATTMTEKMQATASDMFEARDEMTRLVSGSRAGIMRALKGVVESKNALGKTTTAVDDVLGALSLSIGGLERQLDGHETAISDASRSVAEQSAAYVSAIAAQVDTMLQGAGDAFAAAASQAAAAAAAPIRALDTATQKHAGAVEEEMKALAEHSAVLARSSEALQAVEAMTALVERQAQAAERQLKDQSSALEPMMALVSPAKEALAAVATLDIKAYDKALQSIDGLATKLGDVKPQDYSQVLAALQRALADMQEQLPQQFAALTQQIASHIDTVDTLSPAEYEAFQDDMKQMLKQGDEALSDAVQSVPSAVVKPLQAALETVTKTLKPADQAPLFDALGSQMEAQVKAVIAHIERSREELVEQAAGAAKAAAGVKSQLKKLGQETTGQNEGLKSDLKHLRANQIQSLKLGIKSVPDAVTQQITPRIEAHLEALHARLDTALERLPAPVEALSIVEPDAEPPQEDVAATLGERLKAALAAMDEIEADVTGFAAAALAAPDAAAASDIFVRTLEDAESVLTGWGNKLDNVATAVALARDAS